MAAAVTQLQIGTGAGPTWGVGGASAEGGIKFNREDTATGTTPVPIPTATGTNYSWYKTLALAVTGAGTTTISNRKVYTSGAPTTGLYLFYKAVGAYTQATSGNAPGDSGSQGATPSTYSTVPTAQGSAATWDANGVASNAGANGQFIQLVCGVGNNYVSGAGNAIALPDFKFQYDEA